MKKIIFLISIILLLCSCNSKQEEIKKDSVFKIGYSSNLINAKDKEELRKVFEENKISNIDLFFKWLDDFNKEEDMGCGLKTWDKTENFIYNDANCANRFEKNHSMSDGDCRITSYALMQNLININTIENEYGTYLMFDMDVIENNKDYEVIKERYLDFINVFNEMDVSKINKDDYKDVFPNKLKSHDFRIEDGNVSLISVVLNDSDFDLLFIGHAGILIDLKDKYLFIEKIAFEQPYQLSVLKSKDELITLFKNRSSYFGDNNSKGPFIYENDQLIYEYK